MITRRRFMQTVAAGSALVALRTWASETTSSPGRKLGVALVGLGNYSTYQLAPALQRTRRCRLAGVVTGTPEKGVRWRREYGLPADSVYSYETMEHIADNPEIDVVYVVTPPGLHAEHTIRAARTGRHVICEKPMARNVAECEAMIAACRESGVQLAIGYRLHFEPHHREFARMAATQELGVWTRSGGANGFRLGGGGTWRTDASLAGGGSLMDMGVYVVQAACKAHAGVPVAATAEFVPPTRPEVFGEVEETIRWRLEFADGAVAAGESTYTAGVSRYRAEGAEGWADLGSPAFYYGGQSLTTSRGPRRFPAVNHQVAQLDALAADFQAGRPNPVPGEMGRRDIAIIEAIYRAARTGRRAVVTA
jgi:glucose-fructose oxidoreductase